MSEKDRPAYTVTIVEKNGPRQRYFVLDARGREVRQVERDVTKARQGDQEVNLMELAAHQSKTLDRVLAEYEERFGG